MKRPLSFVCLSYAGAMLLANLFGFANAVWLLVFFFAAGAAALLFQKKKAAAAALSGAAAVCCFLAYSALLYQPALRLPGENLEIRGVVARETEDTFSSRKCEVKVQSVSGRKVNVRILLYGRTLPDLFPGEIITFQGNLYALSGEASYIRSSLSDGIFLRGYLPAKAQLQVVEKQVSLLRSCTETVKRYVSDRLTKTLKPETAALAKAVLLGDTGGLTAWQSDAYSKAGIYHAFSVSGMHVAFLSLLLLGFVTLLGVPRRFAGIPVTLLLLFFAAMLDFQAPVTRAVLMAAVLFLAQLSARRADTLTSLSLAAAVLLTVNPFSAMDTGLQLSFAAVYGILFFSKRWEAVLLAGAERLRLPVKWLRPVASSLAVSAAASLLTFPILLIAFDRVSILSPLTNLLSLWAVAGIFYGGLLLAVLPVAPVSAAVSFLLDILCRYTRFISETVAGWKISTVSSGAVFLYLVLFFGILLYVLCRLRPNVNRAAAVLCVFALLFAGSASYSLRKDGLTFAAVDVGQGEALALIRGEHAVVVDCGSSTYGTSALKMASYLNERGIRQLDAVIVTHSHVDHIGGVSELLENVPTQTLYIGRDGPPSELGKAAITTAEGAGTAVRLVDEDISFSLGEDVKISLYASPSDGVDFTNESRHNDASLMALIKFGDSEILLTGDAPELSERRLMEAGDFDVDILNAAHHGSAYSSSEAFLAETTPDAAVISVGSNSYGLPSEKALDRIRGYTDNIYTTQVNGTVEFSTSGDGHFKIRTEKKAA